MNDVGATVRISAINLRTYLPIAMMLMVPDATCRLYGETVNLIAMNDTTIYSEANDLSNGTGSYMFSGNTAAGNTRRALIRFDVSGSIPAGATITSASLQLYMSRTQASAMSVRLHRILADWGEGTSNADQQEGSGAIATDNDATWGYRFFVESNPSSSPVWATSGGDYNVAPSASVSVAGIGNYTWGSNAAMIGDVQTWLNTPAANYGWLLVGNETQSQTSKRFETSEASQTARRPRLTIVYTPSPNSGACCFANGSCQSMIESACTTAGGAFQGIGASCTPNPCPQPTGACCFDNATCQELTAADCSGQSGEYQGDFSMCMPDMCPIVLTPYLDPLPIPPLATPTAGAPGEVATYDIQMVQVQQQLHSELPPTTLWTYEGIFPGPTILATRGKPVTVNWINDLRDEFGDLRTTHYLPVDLCPHGAANQPKTVVHLHGGHVPAAYDGYPESTFLPGDSVTYVYPNQQLPALIWYHDHALGITRLNVYMGLAGGYLITDSFEQSLNLPPSEYDVPLIIQDRTFHPDGSLLYPAEWEEHFFGDKILVNGKVWPYFNVKQGKYRFRALNGCNSRTLKLSLSNGQTFQLIGTDGGLLPAPVTLSEITLGPAERADLIVDFSSYPSGTEIIFQNSAPAPYPAGDPMHDIPNVMKFVVQNQPGFIGAIPATLRPMETLDPQSAVTTRELTLASAADPCTGSMWLIDGMHWDHIHEYPMLGTTEIWSFINRSGISHPMHMHMIFFQVLERQDFNIVDGQVVPIGNPIPAPPQEGGWKDTVMAHPGQITRVIARFDDYMGRYPYHCHILEHEDHGMMRQFEVVGPPAGIPANSTWGIVIFGLALLIAATIITRLQPGWPRTKFS